MNTIRYHRLQAANSKGTHSKQDWEALKAEFDFRCIICNKLESEIPGGLVRSRIIPLCQGGDNSINNIQPCCQSCASKKGPDTTNYVTLRRAGTGSSQSQPKAGTVSSRPLVSRDGLQNKKGCPDKGLAIKTPQIES